MATQEELGKIHQSPLKAKGLVGFVDLQKRFGEVVAPRFYMPCPTPLILLPIDEPGHLARGPALFVKIEAAEDPLDQALLVIRIENLKVFGKARFLPVGPQEAMGEAVKGADPKLARGNGNELLKPRPHLRGGLVRKGHGQKAMGRQPLGLGKPGHAMGEHTGLPRAGAGEHEHVPTGRGDRRPLRIV